MKQLSAWVDAINHPGFGDSSRKDRAIAEMRSAGVDSVLPLLIDRLGDSDPEARCEAITALFFLDAKRAVEPIVGMLSEPDKVVRWHACGCLHELGDERAIPALCEVLRRDPEPQVRGMAAYALGGIGSPAAIPSLLATLGSDNEYDMHGHSPSSCAAMALDDILGTQEMRIHVRGGHSRMAPGEPDLDQLRRLAEELFERWSVSRG